MHRLFPRFKNIVFLNSYCMTLIVCLLMHAFICSQRFEKHNFHRFIRLYMMFTSNMLSSDRSKFCDFDFERSTLVEGIAVLYTISVNQ